MSKPVFRRGRAEEDILGAVEFHLREAGESTAQEFIDALENAFLHLSEQPASGSPRYALELELPGHASPVDRTNYYILCLASQ